MNINKAHRAAAAVCAVLFCMNTIAGGIAAADKHEPENEDFTPRRGDSAPGVRNEKAEERVDMPSGISAGSDIMCQSNADASGWYCRHMENGARPPVPPEMSYIGECGGYFIDPDEEKRVIYLTFDAGYENGNIEKILDTLKEEGVPGAFFVLENLVTSNTELVRRMIDEGHTVCNHTARHHDMTKMNDDGFTAELEKMEEIYRSVMGCEISKYYRPPEGRFNRANLECADRLGYKTIFWSYAYADWDNNNQMAPEAAIKKVLAGTHNGEVILLHPTSATNAEILPELIHEWKKMGYTFGTLDQLTMSSDGSGGAEENTQKIGRE